MINLKHWIICLIIQPELQVWHVVQGELFVVNLCQFAHHCRGKIRHRASIGAPGEHLRAGVQGVLPKTLLILSACVTACRICTKINGIVSRKLCFSSIKSIFYLILLYTICIASWAYSFKYIICGLFSELNYTVLWENAV